MPRRPERKPASTEWAANIARLLEVRDWSNTELAQRTGLTKSQVGRLINDGSKNPEIRQLRTVARALGVELWELFVPAEVATSATKGLPLGTPLTPEGVSRNGEEEAQIDLSTLAQAGSAGLSPATIRAAVSLITAIRELSSGPQARTEEGRDIARRAIERHEPPTEHHGPVPAGNPSRPGRRGKRAG